LLSDNEKIGFYEALAHNLTVSIKSISFDENIDDKKNQIKWINEIMHELVQRTSHLRLGTNSWSDKDFYENTKHWVFQSKDLAGDISWALDNTLKHL